MDNPREHDEFARIDLHNKLERDREIVTMYERHLAIRRAEIEDKVYELGTLDERLGSDSL